MTKNTNYRNIVIVILFIVAKLTKITLSIYVLILGYKKRQVLIIEVELQYATAVLVYTICTFFVSLLF